MRKGEEREEKRIAYRKGQNWDKEKNREEQGWEREEMDHLIVFEDVDSCSGKR